MLNEIAPIFLAVTSNRDYRRFIIDEAEATLHPEKQLELVRFLKANRLYRVLGIESKTLFYTLQEF